MMKSLQLECESPLDNDAVRPHWRKIRLGEAFSLTKKPARLRYSDFERIPFVPMEAVPVGRMYFDQFTLKQSSEVSSGTYFEPGDVLVAKITPSFENGKQGIIEILPAPFGVATTEVIPLKEIPGLSDKHFLFYYLLRQDVRAAMAAKMEGSTGRQRLSANTLTNWELELPPLEEQRAIAHVLRTVQDAIQARRRELELERERKAALMQHLFTYGTRGERTKQTEIGEMPESWEIRHLRELADVAYGLTVNEARRTSTKQAPYLTVANVIRGALRLEDVKQIGMMAGDADRYHLEPGDVLLIEGNGNPKLLGSAAVWNGELPFALHQNHLIRARPSQSRVLPLWLMSYLNSDDGRAQLLGRSKTSSGLHSINSHVVSDLLIPLPSIGEQCVGVEAMKACDSRLVALDHESALLEELFRALLEELMTGRLSAVAAIDLMAAV